MGLHHVAIAAATYSLGRAVRVDPPALAARTARVVVGGGVVSTKLAQIVASRVDVIDDDHLLRALRELQSRRVDEDTFEASIATVRIDRDANVAVKTIKDPSILREARVLEAVAHFLRAVVSIWPEHPAGSVLCTIQTLLQEFDLRAESKKNEMLVGALPRDGVVKVPITYHSDDSCARMEFVPSVLAKDLTEAVDIGTVDRFFADVAFAALGNGVLHMDLHSGNVGFDGERIVVYDMGSVQSVDAELVHRACRGLMESAECLAFGDYEGVADRLRGNGLVTSIGSVDSLRDLLDTTFAYASGRVDAKGVANSMREIGGDVCIDPSLFQLLQSISLAEGTCKVLNGAFTIENAVKSPYFVGRIAEAVERLAIRV